MESDPNADVNFESLEKRQDDLVAIRFQTRDKRICLRRLTAVFDTFKRDKETLHLISLRHENGPTPGETA